MEIETALTDGADGDSRARGRRRDAGTRGPATTLQSRSPTSRHRPCTMSRGIATSRPSRRPSVTSPRGLSRRQPSSEAPASQPSPPGRTDAERVARLHRRRLGCDGSRLRRPMPSTATRPGSRAPGRFRTPRSWRATSRGGSVGSETDDLARVSQHVSLTEGRVDLYRTLRELLVKADGAPSSVHRFVARVPETVARAAAARATSWSSRRTTTPLLSGPSTRYTSRTTWWSSSPPESTGAGSCMFRGGTRMAAGPGQSRCPTSTWISRSTKTESSSGQ